MPYFPQQDQRPNTYWCPVCKAHFTHGTRRCLVAHAPGTCCHHYETRVESRAEGTSNNERFFANAWREGV